MASDSGRIFCFEEKIAIRSEGEKQPRLSVSNRFPAMTYCLNDWFGSTRTFINYPCIHVDLLASFVC